MTKKRIVKQTSKQVVIEPPKRIFGRSYYILIILVAMALSATYLIISGKRSQEVQPKNAESQVADIGDSKPKEQPKSLVDRVKRHILVPDQETPYIATISNIDLVQQKMPDFYKHASQGDKVLVWSDKAVIYSEERDLIIAVMASSVANETTTSTTTAVGATGADVKQLSIEVRNGTRTAGLAGTVKQTLTSNGFRVSRVGDASLRYATTTIVTGVSQETDLSPLTSLVSGSTTSSLPAGEAPTTADVLILLGQ